MAENNQKKIILLIVFAFLVRLLFIYPQYSGDIKNHIAWGQSITEQGTSSFYSKSFPGFNDANYPPLTIFIFALSHLLYQAKIISLTFLNQNLSLFPSFIIPYTQTINFEALFFKLPAILADLGIGWLLYKLTKNKIIASLYLLNPAVIYISTVWGQIESIPIFFLLLTLYLIKIQKLTLSHLSFLMAILTKQTALWLAPVFLIIWFKNQTKKRFILGLLIQLLGFILIYLPFTGPTNAITSYLSTLSGSSIVVSDAAWNLWFFITSPQTQDSASFLGLTFRLWSIILLVGIYSITGFKLFKKTDFSQMTISLFLLSLAAFFIQTRVHERHLFPALVFMLLLNIKNKNLLFLSYIALSSYHMLNLYYSLSLPFL